MSKGEPEPAQEPTVEELKAEVAQLKAEKAARERAAAMKPTKDTPYGQPGDPQS